MFYSKIISRQPAFVNAGACTCTQFPHPLGLSVNHKFLLPSPEGRGVALSKLFSCTLREPWEIAEMSVSQQSCNDPPGD